jgi:hypothetical protein
MKMQAVHWVLLAEVAAVLYLLHQGRNDYRPAAPLARSHPLLNPATVRRSTTAGPNPTGTVGAVTYREGGGLY